VTIQTGQDLRFLDIAAQPNAFASDEYSNGTSLVVRLDDVNGHRVQIDLPPAAFLELLQTLREHEDDAQDMLNGEQYAAQGGAA